MIPKEKVEINDLAGLLDFIISPITDWIARRKEERERKKMEVVRSDFQRKVRKRMDDNFSRVRGQNSDGYVTTMIRSDCYASAFPNTFITTTIDPLGYHRNVTVNRDTTDILDPKTFAIINQQLNQILP